MILITGGALGLGRAVALKCAKRGYPVVIHYRKSQIEAEETAYLCREAGVVALTIQGEFSSEESTNDFIRRYLSLNIETNGLINNIGAYHPFPFEKTTPLEFRVLFETNLFAPYALIYALQTTLKRVVNVGVAGLHSHRADMTAPGYRTAKLGLAHLTVALARELAPQGITVNMVSPGQLETSVDAVDPIALPMKRYASLEETAHIILSFFEKEYSYVTGQNIEVAGGYSL